MDNNILHTLMVDYIKNNNLTGEDILECYLKLYDYNLLIMNEMIEKVKGKNGTSTNLQ